MTDSDPIFVVGVGRSGTSLVQSILGSHSDISFPPETAFLRRYIFSGSLAAALRWNGEGGVRTLLAADGYLSRLPFSLDELLSDVDFERVDVGIDIYRRLLARHAGQEGKQHSGDKDPRLIEYLPKLIFLFPSARIVHVSRDPRDVMVSKKKARWSSGRSVFSHVLAGQIQWRLAERARLGLSSSAYFSLCYEELLVRPEEVVRELCQWLGVEFEAGMLDFSDTARKLVSEEEMQWKKETLQPLQQDNSGKWQSGLSMFEQGLVEGANAALFRKGCYERSGPAGWRAGLLKLAGLAMGQLSRIPAEAYVAIRERRDR